MIKIASLLFLLIATACQNPSLTKTYGLNGIGVQNYISDGSKDEIYYNYEYKAKPVYYSFRPIAGFTVNKDLDAYVYGGGEMDFALPYNFYISPSFAGGYYRVEDGEDLGGKTIFRSGGSLKYKLKSDNVISIGAYNLSNFGLDDKNPGADIVQINYEVAVPPFTKYF